MSKTQTAQKIQKSPEAIAALKILMEALQKEGVDITTGKPPSTMAMMKLATKKNVREAFTTAGEALRKAGIDMTDKATLDDIMTAMKKD